LAIKDEQEKDIINTLSPFGFILILKEMVTSLLLKNIVIMVSFLLMILFLKINCFGHIRNFKTNI
jgi:hypothetical protein